jgi:hypothetical protein
MHAGGFVGVNKGKILNCYATGDVHSYSVFGGFVGVNKGNIYYCYATGSLEKITGYHVSYTAGGFVGSNEGQINNAYATGNVTSEYTGAGFVSSNSGTILNAYATGKVSGKVEPAGFVGTNRKNIENVFFAGKTVANGAELHGAGCFVAGNDGSVKNALYNKDGCGFGTDSTVDGVAFTEMKNASLYKNWTDFDKYWTLNDTMSYPQLVFTAGVLPEIPIDDPPIKVKSNTVVAKGANGLKLYGNHQNLQATVTLSRSGLTNVKVYNLKGVLQKTVSLGKMSEGVHQVNLSGAVDARGVALIVLEQNGKALSRTLLR